MFGKGIKGWSMTVFALAVVSLLSLRPGAVPVVHAATFTVSNLNDAGTGSLRQAIVDANATTEAADTITFAARLTGTIALGSQLPEIVG